MDATIRALVDGVRKALHDKDVDRLMTYYPRDFLTFDLAPPLSSTSTSRCRSTWTAA